MIQLQVIGNIGADCTANNANGKTVINFTLAHTEKWKNAKGEQQERTTWMDCAVWDRDSLAPYLVKGAKIFVSGTPDARAWADKASGELRATLKLTVLSIELLTPKAN